ncbi:sigma-70 family RNA polymerase sigma factor [Paenirhodobacter sp.]|uniref:sigma-70 family RNA polymerase sigma factor n=1 Tax=Paenirhodobacter sp. TaxID=1965326 RepID=UPI003B421043
MDDNDRRLDLYLAHRREFLDYAAAITGDRAQGEDVVQDAFLRFSSETASRPLDEPLGYLWRIIRNLALDWRRSRKAEGRYIDPDADASWALHDQPMAEEALACRDELRIVMAAIAELPERTRDALEMHRFEGLKLREIADRLGVSTATAHGLVYEGLAYCRYRLDGDSPAQAKCRRKKPPHPLWGGRS